MIAMNTQNLTEVVLDLNALLRITGHAKSFDLELVERLQLGSSLDYIADALRETLDAMEALKGREIPASEVARLFHQLRNNLARSGASMMLSLADFERLTHLTRYYDTEAAA